MNVLRWLKRDTSTDLLIRAQREEIVYLRGALVKAQDRIIQMSDPLLEARVAGVQKAAATPQRVGPPGPGPVPHNPRLLALQMEQRERERERALGNVSTSPPPDRLDVERSFRRTE